MSAQIQVEQSRAGLWFYVGCIGGQHRRWLPWSIARRLIPDIGDRQSFDFVRVPRPCDGAITLVGRLGGNADVWFGPDRNELLCRRSLLALGIRIKRRDVRWYVLRRIGQ